MIWLRSGMPFGASSTSRSGSISSRSGLVYDVTLDHVTQRGVVQIIYTLTTPGCPMKGIITEEIRHAVSAPGVASVTTRLVGDPSWHAGMIAPNVW